MIKVGSHCSGIGTYNFALQQLGIPYRNVFACEIDSNARRTYLANHAAPDAFYQDVTKIDNSQCKYVDLYVWSFPCQPFSQAGQRKGITDPRGILFNHGHDYIKKQRPRFFIGENVTGLLSIHKPKGSKSPYGKTFVNWVKKLGCEIHGMSMGAFMSSIDWVQKDLFFGAWRPDADCCNYYLRVIKMNAKDYGVPQNRDRVFLIGFRDKEDYLNYELPKPFPLKKSLSDVLEKDVPASYNLSEKAIRSIVMNMNNLQQVSINPAVAACLQSPGNACGIYKGCNVVLEENDLRQIRSNLCLIDNQKIIDKVVQLNPSTESGGVQPYTQNRVYHPNGLSPALTLECGRYNVLEKVQIFQQGHGNNAGGFMDLCPTITASSFQGNNFVLEQFALREVRSEEAKAIRRTYQKKGRDYTLFRKKEIEPRPDQVMNCLTAGGIREKLILEVKYFLDVHGYIIKGILKKEKDDYVFLPLLQYRIRRLTKKECERLMGLPENFVQPNKKTAAYKQYGNGIVVDCLREIIKGMRF